MTRRSETGAQLRARILKAMQADIGISEQMAKPFVESIMRCFAGERQYFPAKEREYPIAEIRSDLERGTPTEEVLRKHDLSRSTLHSLFPGGLPRGAAVAREKLKPGRR